MAVWVDMPKLGVNMTKGTIVKWLVGEGEAVRAGQPLFEVETDKVVQEVEASATGVLAKILAQEEQEVPCTTVIGVITAPGEALPEEIPTLLPGADRPQADVEVRVPREGPGAEAEARAAVPAGKRVPITPLARRLAREWGVDTRGIVPRGKRITKADVEAAYAAQRAAPAAAPTPVAEAPARMLPQTRVRRATAERMDLSARTVARVGLTVEVDATALIGWRERLREGGDGVGYNELLAKLVAHALSEYPYMNAQLVEGEVRGLAEINVGIATDTEQGLLVPVVRAANTKGARQIGREFAALVERARRGESTVDDLTGGSFTLTNLGMYEIETFLPIINVPQCAILGVGAIVKKAVVVEEALEIRPRMTLTLAFDHRLVDGAPAARFLQRLKHLIEEPLEMVS